MAVTNDELTAILKRFDDPDEVNRFPNGKFETVALGPMIIGRATYAPGWKWSRDVGAPLGEKFCTVEHVGLVLAGRATAAFENGPVVEMTEGDFFYIPPRPHDSWVVGDAPYVSLHFLGAGAYARRDDAC